MPLLLPLLVAASCLSSAAAYGHEEVCYGSTFSLSFEYFPPMFFGKLIFIPSAGGAEQVVMQSKKSKDPRYKVRFSSVELQGVTRRDDGTFWLEPGYDLRYQIIRLVIKECSAPLSKSYMDTFRRASVVFDYVEFAAIGNPDVETLLWTRSDPQAGQGRVQFKHNAWELKGLTQADSGFYNFRKKDGTLLGRIKLEVMEHNEERRVQEGKELYIDYPGFDVSNYFWKVTLINDEKSQVLMEDGKWLRPGYNLPEHHFFSRVETTSSTFVVEPVTPAYAGIYEFRDRDGNLILSVEVTVYPAYIPIYFHIAIFAGGILLIVVCCCCWKKCCSKKTAPKRVTPQLRTYNQDVDQTSPPTYSSPSYPASAAQPPSYHSLNFLSSSGEAPSHDPPDVDQTSAPSYSAHSDSVSAAQPPSYHSLNFLSSSVEAPSHDPTFTAPVPSLSMGSNCLSSDAEPRFELNGVTFSALGSDSTNSDVYNSDKLNFM